MEDNMESFQGESKLDDEEKKVESKIADNEPDFEDDEADSDEVILRVIIQPEGFPHFISMPQRATIEELKEAIAQDLQLPVEALVLSGEGLESKPDLTHLEIATEYQVNLHIERDVAEASSQYKLPSKLDVVVHFDDDERPSKTITVEIVREDLNQKKPYLGGYRHTKTGTLYHHAATQRERSRNESKDGEVEGVVKFTRETQTAIVVTRSAQTRKENGTQMARPDLYLDTSKDRHMTPGEYFDSDQLHLLRVESTITIQRYWRGYVARSVAETLRQGKIDRLNEQRRQEEQKVRDEEERHQLEVQRRMNPTSVADFEILYNELENWRQHETVRINSTQGLNEKERLKQLEELLHKETKLLQTIDRLKLTANEKNRKERINRILSMMASPKRWKMADGDVTLVHTPFTARAKELMELYEGLNASGLSVDERLDILLHVKWTVKEFDCDLTRDLVDLIDREADLLNRGRSEKAMGGLRKRISTLFLHFIETPEFNPEAARFQQVPSELINRPQIAPKKIK